MKFRDLVSSKHMCYLTVDYDMYRMSRAHFSHSTLTIPWVPEVILFSFTSEESKQSGEAASTRRLPSEPEKRLIFTPAIRQRASGTTVP